MLIIFNYLKKFIIKNININIINDKIKCQKSK